jgi:endonuclease YncB( thermonuclease family)
MGQHVLRLLLAVLLSVVAILPLAAEDLSGEAVIIDGDTLEVSGTRVRLHGIDAPEKAQECEVSGSPWRCGENATRVLSSATQGRRIECHGIRRDRYGRLIAVCYASGTDLNAEMVREGWALAYRQYSSDYVNAEAAARAAGKGIWRGQFIEPWEWRSAKRQAR